MSVRVQTKRDEEHGLTKEEKAFGAAAGAAALYYSPEERDAFLRTRYNYTWTHPSSEKTKVQGFSPKMLKDLNRGMTSIDQKTPLDQSFGGHKILYTGKRNPMSGAAGMTWRNKVILGRNAMTGHYEPSAVFTHEMAHVLDGSNQYIIGKNGWDAADKAPEVAEAFGWKPTGSQASAQPGFRKFKMTGPRSKVNPEAYQSTDLIEDWAEQFRTLHGFKNMTRGPITKREMPLGRMVNDKAWKKFQEKGTKAEKELYAVKVNPEASRYLRSHVIRTRPLDVDRTNHRVDLSRAPIYNRRNITVGLGGAALVGGGYYYVKHRKEIHQKLHRWEHKFGNFIDGTETANKPTHKIK